MLYQQVTLWRRESERTAIRYSCLMNLSSGKYSVQSAHFYQLPLTDQVLKGFDEQFVELLCECDPTERAGAFDSLNVPPHLLEHEQHVA